MIIMIMLTYLPSKPFGDQSWTMTHGHFLDMGGFILVDPPNEQLGPFNQVLTLERFQELVRDPGFVFPVLTAADVKDRSKGDGLLKVIAIVQTGWFTIQCIARCVQRLALTELELLTLTLASLNALTLLCWWSKPSGVKEPTRIYLAVQPTAEGPYPDRDNWDYEFNVSVTAADIISKSVAALKEGVVYIAHFFRSPFKQHSWLTTLGSFSIIPFLLFFMITFPIYVLLSLGILALLRMVKTKKVQKPQDDDPIATRAVLNLVRFRYSLTFRIRRYFGMWLEIVFPSHSIARIFAWPFLPLFFFVLLMFLVILSPFFAISFMASFIFTAVFGIVTTNNVRRNSICVPCFYAARTRSDRYSRMTVFVLFGTIFGSIQCIAWYFTYPTDSERTLWRVTALTLTVIPFVAAPIDWTLENRRQRIIRFFQVALELFLTIVLVIYVFARISLIAQAYALLRKQPPDAFVAVDWTKYIPHIF